MKISVIIPCYNEAKNIPIIINEFKKLDKVDFELELVLVNNGSNDYSGKILNEEMKKNQFITVVNVDVNQGYGYGILQGLKYAKGEYLAWLHADMQISPKEILTAVKIIKRENFSEKIFIKGERMNRPLVDRFFTACMSIFESVYLGEKLYDIGAIPVCFHRSFCEKLLNPPFDFSLELYVYCIAMKNKYKLCRFPVVQSERVFGESSWNSGMLSRIKQVRKVLNYSFKLKKNL